MYLYRSLSDETGIASLGSSSSDLDVYQTYEEERELREIEITSDSQFRTKILLKEILDITPFLNDAASAIVDDTFTRCFKSNTPEPWNWNWYLFPLWCMGLVVRYGILFPLRLLFLISGTIFFLMLFIPVHLTLQNRPTLQKSIERSLMEFILGVFVASWTGVVKYHGPRPSPRPNHIWVANHTSMIDFIILAQVTPFAVIMQRHEGWVGIAQKYVLSCVGCIWFNRTDAKDRAQVVETIQMQVADPDSNPILVFPEGTCVNNEYIVMFKKKVFELGCTICPIAIKYNKTFVDAFWNSRRQSFTCYLMRLMTSWAVVCDVWYLQPHTIRSGESAIDFADRVRDSIANRAGIKKVPWDGLYKYLQPSPKLRQEIQKVYSQKMMERMALLYDTGDKVQYAVI